MDVKVGKQNELQAKLTQKNYLLINLLVYSQKKMMISQLVSQNDKTLPHKFVISKPRTFRQPGQNKNNTFDPNSFKKQQHTHHFYDSLEVRQSARDKSEKKQVQFHKSLRQFQAMLDCRSGQAKNRSNDAKQLFSKNVIKTYKNLYETHKQLPKDGNNNIETINNITNSLDDLQKKVKYLLMINMERCKIKKQNSPIQSWIQAKKTMKLRKSQTEMKEVKKIVNNKKQGTSHKIYNKENKPEQHLDSKKQQKTKKFNRINSNNNNLKIGSQRKINKSIDYKELSQRLQKRFKIQIQQPKVQTLQYSLTTDQFYKRQNTNDLLRFNKQSIKPNPHERKSLYPGLNNNREITTKMVKLKQNKNFYQTSPLEKFGIYQRQFSNRYFQKQEFDNKQFSTLVNKLGNNSLIDKYQQHPKKNMEKKIRGLQNIKSLLTQIDSVCENVLINNKEQHKNEAYLKMKSQGPQIAQTKSKYLTKLKQNYRLNTNNL